MELLNIYISKLEIVKISSKFLKQNYRFSKFREIKENSSIKL